jgi:hypothetical protein
MASSKKKSGPTRKSVAKKKTAAGPRAAVQAAPAGRSKLWMVPASMALVLLGLGIFIVCHARYLASLTFDMVREDRIIPQGRGRGQSTGLANMAGDAQGNLIMLESQDPAPVRLQRFDRLDSPDTLLYTPAKPGQDLTGAVDVDCDAKGDVYVLLKDGRVQVLDNNLVYLRTLQTGIAGASAASVNSAGRVYVADQPGNKVVFFDADGRRAGEIGAPGKSDVSLVSPVLLRVTPADEIVVIESTPTGLHGKIFTKEHALRKTFLVDKITYYPPVRMGVNSQDKAFFNDPGGPLGIVCYDLATGKYFGSAAATKDGVQFISPGCIGADRFTPDVYVHTVPGLVKCVLPQPGGDKE